MHSSASGQAALENSFVSNMQALKWPQLYASICHQPRRTFDKLMCVFSGICSMLRSNRLLDPENKKCLSGRALWHAAGGDAVGSTSAFLLRNHLDTVQKAGERQLHSGSSLKPTPNAKELASAGGSVLETVFIGIQMQRESVYFPGSGLFSSPTLKLELPATELSAANVQDTLMVLLHFSLG